jgi:ACR3 family arsenite efflux pump ArsB
MDIIALILLIAALVCFLLAALDVPARVNLVALGLLFWVIVPLIAAVKAL